MASPRTALDDHRVHTPVPILRDSKLNVIRESRVDVMSSYCRSFEKVFVMEYTSEEDENDTSVESTQHKRFFCWWLPKKQWLTAVIASVVITLMVVVLVLFVGILPAVFQSNMDKVQLRINYMDIKSMPTDNTSNTIDVELSIRIEAEPSVSSTMDEAHATLYYQNKPFSAVTLPAQSLKSGMNAFDLVLRNQADITDPEVFHALSKALITEENVLVDARALVRVRAMGLSYGDLTLDREFTIKAFNQFRDPKPVFNNINLSVCTPTAYKMLINMTLDNVAQVGIGGIGALNMSVYYQQSYLGQAISTDASLGLPRGLTPMLLELTVPKNLESLPAMTGMLTGMLAMNAQFYATGNHPYATQAVLLKDAFAALNMSMPYVDGLKKVALNPQCDLLSLLSAATSPTTTTTTATTTTAPPNSSPV